MMNDVELEECKDFIENHAVLFSECLKKHGLNEVLKVLEELLESDYNDRIE